MLDVDPAADGARLDRWLSGRLEDMSRARLQDLVRRGRVHIDGDLVTEPSRRVKSGQRASIDLPAPEPMRIDPEPMELDIRHEDEDLLVLVKPAGLVVHPSPGHDTGTLVHALLAHCGESLSGIGGVQRPGIVHRLDKDVSGLLMVAKNDRAHRSLSAQLTVHSVERVYEAVVSGVPSLREGKVEGAIGRHPRDRKRMAVIRTGKPARTDYRVLDDRNGMISRIRLELHTGRTHQIRVHMTSLGHPLMGDPIYRARRKGKLPAKLEERARTLDRIALHATVIGFDHPSTGERIRFECPPPPLFDELLELAGS